MLRPITFPHLCSNGYGAFAIICKNSEYDPEGDIAAWWWVYDSKSSRDDGAGLQIRFPNWTVVPA